MQGRKGITKDMVSEFLDCPITHEIFYHAVLLHTGSDTDADADAGIIIEQEIADNIIDNGDGLCPITRLPIVKYSTDRRTNNFVAAYLETNPDKKKNQYKSANPESRAAITKKRVVSKKPSAIVSPSPAPACSAAPAPQAALADAISPSSVPPQDDAASRHAQELADAAMARELQEAEASATPAATMDPAVRESLLQEISSYYVRRPENFLRDYGCPETGYLFRYPVALDPTGRVTEQCVADRIIDEGDGLCLSSNKQLRGYTAHHKDAKRIADITALFLELYPQYINRLHPPYPGREHRVVALPTPPAAIVPPHSKAPRAAQEFVKIYAKRESPASPAPPVPSKKETALKRERELTDAAMEQEAERYLIPNPDMHPAKPESLMRDMMALDNPEVFLHIYGCAHTHNLMRHPVSLKPSHCIVEQCVADEIIDKGDGLCPLTRKPLTGYTTTRTTQEYIDRAILFLEMYPDYDHKMPAPYQARARRDVTSRSLKSFSSPTACSASPSSHTDGSKRVLLGENKQLRKTLVSDLRNLIFALGFEQGPVESILTVNPQLCPGTLFSSPVMQPWQEIAVDKSAPKDVAMYEVLKAAMLALEQLDPRILDAAKIIYAEMYDRVQSKDDGEVLNAINCVRFLKHINIENQPGLLVHYLLERVEAALQSFCPKPQVSPSK